MVRTRSQSKGTGAKEPVAEESQEAANALSMTNEVEDEKEQGEELEKAAGTEEEDSEVALKLTSATGRSPGAAVARAPPGWTRSWPR